MNPEVSDAQWEVIRPLIPPQGRIGRPRADDRRTLDGILYVLRTGCRWEDLPGQYGHPSPDLSGLAEVGTLAGALEKPG